MKYYSEVLNEKFDTIEELEQAEAADKEKEFDKEKLIEKIKDEQNNYEMARERANELKKEAKDMVDEAMDRLVKAIGDYNKKYGVYVEKNSDSWTSFMKDFLDDPFNLF